MHKIFAKPSFLGKNVVYLPECHSTNDELSELSKRSPIKEGTLLYTGFQTKGKGQRGNRWVSEPNKNILCSIFLKPQEVKLSSQFYLNLVVGLAVIDVLDELILAEKYLKWPNDVYISENKIGGILIETNIKNGMIESAILGIGLNINQSHFSLSNVTSILLETNRYHLVEDVIEHMLCAIEKWYDILLAGHEDRLISHYYNRLFWMNELHEFKGFGNLFLGKIKGIDEHGRLVIEKENGNLQAFNIKEVEFIK